MIATRLVSQTHHLGSLKCGDIQNGVNTQACKSRNPAKAKIQKNKYAVRRAQMKEKRRAIAKKNRTGVKSETISDGVLRSPFNLMKKLGGKSSRNGTVTVNKNRKYRYGRNADCSSNKFNRTTTTTKSTSSTTTKTWSSYRLIYSQQIRYGVYLRNWREGSHRAPDILIQTSEEEEKADFKKLDAMNNIQYGSSFFLGHVCDIDDYDITDIDNLIPEVSSAPNQIVTMPHKLTQFVSNHWGKLLGASVALVVFGGTGVVVWVQYTTEAQGGEIQGGKKIEDSTRGEIQPVVGKEIEDSTRGEIQPVVGKEIEDSTRGEIQLKGGKGERGAGKSGFLEINAAIPAREVSVTTEKKKLQNLEKPTSFLEDCEGGCPGGKLSVKHGVDRNALLCPQGIKPGNHNLETCGACLSIDLKPDWWNRPDYACTQCTDERMQIPKVRTACENLFDPYLKYSASDIKTCQAKRIHSNCANFSDELKPQSGRPATTSSAVDESVPEDWKETQWESKFRLYYQEKRNEDKSLLWRNHISGRLGGFNEFNYNEDTSNITNWVTLDNNTEFVRLECNSKLVSDPESRNRLPSPDVKRIYDHEDLEHFDQTGTPTKRIIHTFPNAPGNHEEENCICTYYLDTFLKRHTSWFNRPDYSCTKPFGDDTSTDNALQFPFSAGNTLQIQMNTQHCCQQDNKFLAMTNEDFLNKTSKCEAKLESLNCADAVYKTPRTFYRRIPDREFRPYPLHLSSDQARHSDWGSSLSLEGILSVGKFEPSGPNWVGSESEILKDRTLFRLYVNAPGQKFRDALYSNEKALLLTPKFDLKSTGGDKVQRKFNALKELFRDLVIPGVVHIKMKDLAETNLETYLQHFQDSTYFNNEGRRDEQTFLKDLLVVESDWQFVRKTAEEANAEYVAEGGVGKTEEMKE